MRVKGVADVTTFQLSIFYERNVLNPFIMNVRKFQKNYQKYEPNGFKCEIK